MTSVRFISLVIVSMFLVRPAAAQQRPLVTQDPEPIGAGRILIEGGVDVAHGIFYPLSGLKGNLLTVPTIGVSVGLSSIAELQISGGPYERLSITDRQTAPLASLVTSSGNSTSDVKDVEIGAKIRLLSEEDQRPSLAFRFSTRLPNAKHASGLGQDTTDFSGSLLAAKTVQSIRIVGNIGVAIMSEPLNSLKQNDELTYGASLARAVTDSIEFVGEVNGRWSVRNGTPPVGTESRGILKLGGRYTHGPVRLDSAVFFGLTTVDPTIGVTAGVTYVFNAFSVP